MGLISGYSTILVVIAVGWVLAHKNILDAASQRTLGEIAFFVATPALMIETISKVEFGAVAANVAASAGSLVVCFGAYWFLSARRWHNDPAETLIGALSASYVNVGNLGIATAAYIIGDVTVVVPTLLLQMLLVQPLALAWLDKRNGGGSGFFVVARRLATNPLTIAAAIGVLLGLTHWPLPEYVDRPLVLLGGAAIPMMLMSFGAALRLSPLPGRAGQIREVVTVCTLKLVVMPVVATSIALALGLSGVALLGVVLTAALPTAQNIFLHATRYDVGQDVSRESILITTLASLPISMLLAFTLS